MNIGEKIRSIRKSRGLTQLEVADKAEIAVNSLRNYEANKRQPNMEQLRAIAAALEVSISDLIWQGDGPAKPPLHCVATPTGSYMVSDHVAPKVLHDGLDAEIDDLVSAYSLLSDTDKETVRKMVEFMRARQENKKTPQD